MIKSVTKIEVKAGEKIYQFICDNDCSLGEVHDVLHIMKSFVVKKIVEADEQESKKKESITVEST